MNENKWFICWTIVLVLISGLIGVDIGWTLAKNHPDVPAWVWE